ncbi:MAG: L-threonylcarbamoyladenylate synthase [Pseudomonadota bacterium]
MTIEPQILKALAAGELAILPTETVYGLCADATQPNAVSAIYAAKGRPSFNPLIAHVCGVEMAERYGLLDERAHRLASVFWPGPLTLVVPARPEAQPPLAKAVQAGLPTLALRHPHGPIADAARALGRPLAAPSANLSGQVSATRLDDIEADFPGLASMAGEAPTVGLESTIARMGDDAITILRPGPVLAQDIAAALPGTPVHELNRGGSEQDADIQAPGMMASHYAPRARVRLNARPTDDDAYMAFGPIADMPHNSDRVFQLSETADLVEAARNLYEGLHTLDAKNPSVIAVAAIPHTGLGIAINDRLSRAAAPRPTKEPGSR